MLIKKLNSRQQGLNLSAQSMEIGSESHIFEQSLHVKTTDIRTIFLAAVLIGHIVGCSGGVLFLVEFIVTVMSLVLGGAATISSNAIESWVYFSCFTIAAFWGYLLSRVGLIDGMRTKKFSVPSFYLALFWSIVLGLLTYCLLYWNWDIPTTMIVRLGSATLKEKKSKADMKPLENQLQ